MTQANVLILRTAGTNCDQELAHAFECAGGNTKIAHILDVIRGTISLNDFQILGLPGGFSFGDDVAAGRIHAVEIRAYLMDSLAEFVQQGKLIIGICNGFQVLTNTRLLQEPGHREEQTLTLAANASNRFECRWVKVRSSSPSCIWFPEGRVIDVPVAHAEGRFLVNNEQTLQQLKKNQQIAFSYVSRTGQPADYPANPNGSIDGIAGICDPTGRILGMMPHPERFIRAQSHPSWTRRPDASEGDGLALFRNGIQFVKQEL